MERVKGQPLPLGVTGSKQHMNFAIEVPRGFSCQLKLYRAYEMEPSYIYEMEEDALVRGIRFLGLAEMDAHITEYVYEINNQEVVDPYAKAIQGRSEWGNGSKDNTRASIVISSNLSSSENPDIVIDKSLPILDQNIIAYRLHVRGFTKHVSSKIKHKGTFSGLVEKIPYLLELGVNQVQLLPSYEFIEEGLKLNYWGYTTGFYMAPKSSFCMSEHVIEEFDSMVRSLHRSGIEVILDMPFIDCPSFTYQLDCLRHYVLQYHIDGFLLNPYTTNIVEMKKDPILSQVKLLTQKDAFQIAMRKFLKGDEGMVTEAMWHLRSITSESEELNYNYITNHNGFTLADLVSYDGKHNEMNGENNQDGTEYNYCWNCGAEGVTRKKAVLELRKIQERNAWTLLLLAQGTPCILAGDEFGNSQKGNNNSYCQDNEISWLNWNLLKKNEALFTYVKSLIAFRKTHPVLHQGNALKGMDDRACGLPDVSYHGEEAWIIPDKVSSRQLGVLYSGAHVADCDCYITYNMHWIEHEYALPTLPRNKKWYQIIDTTIGFLETDALVENQRSVEVPPRSIGVFISG